MTNINTAICLSAGKISYKFSSQQGKLTLKKEKVFLIQKQTHTVESKQKEFR